MPALQTTMQKIHKDYIKPLRFPFIQPRLNEYQSLYDELKAGGTALD